MDQILIGWWETNISGLDVELNEFTSVGCTWFKLGMHIISNSQCYKNKPNCITSHFFCLQQKMQHDPQKWFANVIRFTTCLILNGILIYVVFYLVLIVSSKWFRKIVLKPYHSRLYGLNNYCLTCLIPIIIKCRLYGFGVKAAGEPVTGGDFFMICLPRIEEIYKHIEQQ